MKQPYQYSEVVSGFFYTQPWLLWGLLPVWVSSPSTCTLTTENLPGFEIPTR